MKTTLKAWPMIATATIGLCFLTKTVAGWFGVDLPDQQNVDVVRQWLVHAFDTQKNFIVCVSLLLQVLVILPIIEEVYFRFFLYRHPQSEIGGKSLSISLIPTAVILSSGLAIARNEACMHFFASKFGNPTLGLWATLAFLAAVEFPLRTFGGRLVAKAGAIAPMVASSALFSSAHYIAQPFPDSAFVALFFFGLAQCWLYRKTGRIWCAMLNHFLFNLTNLVLLLLLPE